MKIIEAIVPNNRIEAVVNIATLQKATDRQVAAEGADGRHVVRILVSDEQSQDMLDALENSLGDDPASRLIVLPVEASLPRPSVSEEHAARKKLRAIAITREELYESVEKGARLDINFFVLVVLSTIVAAIGLVNNNVAVVIGAMVITPLLESNIALALGTALGDTALMWRSLRTSIVGLGLALAVSVAIALVWPLDANSRQLLAHTDVGLDSVALALASGAAAALSMTTGLESILVGVMVAVALLPPAATCGLMLGSGEFGRATGAGLLLAVNVVCVNLAAKLVLLLKGIHPRTWWEAKRARHAMNIYLTIWAISLAILVGLIFLRRWLLAQS